jgi:hypothetical protein
VKSGRNRIVIHGCGVEREWKMHFVNLLVLVDTWMSLWGDGVYVRRGTCASGQFFVWTFTVILSDVYGIFY